MPGKPLKKIKRLTTVVEQLNKIASDFDALLPPVYRANGRPPTRDVRANAWRAADKSILIATAALGDLLALLRDRATRAVGDNDDDEPKVNGGKLPGETVCPADFSLSPSRRTKG